VNFFSGFASPRDVNFIVQIVFLIQSHVHSNYKGWKIMREIIVNYLLSVMFLDADPDSYS
jgi:hypothetical protein